MLKKLAISVFAIILFLAILYALLAHKNPTSAGKAALTVHETIRWKMANTWGTGMPVFEAAALRFAQNVREMTGGRLVIEVDSANKHKAPFGVFDLVRTGQYEMGHTASYYWKGKDPATPLFTTTPFGMNVLEQYAWFYYGDGLKLMNEVYVRHGLLSFPAGDTGVQMGGWFKKKIHSLADMKGLKIRIPGLAGDVLAKLGAEPVNIPAGELYTALQLGTIDALEWVSPALDIKMGFQQIADNYYTGWHEPASELQFLVNQKAFEQLPTDVQHILKIAMRESAYDMTAHMFYENTMTWHTMQEKYPNVTIQTFPADVTSELIKQTGVVLKELAEESAAAKKIIQSQQDFLKKAKEWTNVGERRYLETR